MTRLDLNRRILDALELAWPRIIVLTKLTDSKPMRQLAISTAYVGILQLLLKGRWQKWERRVELDTANSIIDGLGAKLHWRSVFRRFAITKNPLWENASLWPLLKARDHISFSLMLICCSLT